jgi:transposase
MNPYMSPDERERRRRLAVEWVDGGQKQTEVAQLLGVGKSTVPGWMKTFRDQGSAALASKPRSGRPRKLSTEQENEVLSWFSRSPTEFGFDTELWTAPRVTELIRRKWKIRFHVRYINQWLAQRRITPQKPTRQPRERDEAKIRKWVRYEWPRVKNGRRSSARILS